MGKGVLFLAAFLLSIFVASAYTPPASNRVDTLIDGSWKFIKADVANAQNVSFDDSLWTSINLPHTWNSMDGQDGGNNYYRGIGWYRKHLTVDSSYAGREFFLQFDGANTVTDVYVNGTQVGTTHKGGYAAFRFDVTANLVLGADNVIAVKVNNASDTDVAPLTADFTFCGGIYRDVHFIVVDKLGLNMLDFGSPGVFLKQTKVSASSSDFNLEVKAKVFNNNATSKNVTVESVIVDGSGNVVSTLTATQSVAANTGFDFIQPTVVSSPHLWNGLADPYLYKVYVNVKDGNTVTDAISQPLGFRYYSVDPDTGFYLNGQSYDLHGVNRHQDRINKGWAISPADHLEDFNLIDEMGCTAVRLCHYQHAGYFYDLCDQNGMIVWTELALVNSVNGTTAFSDNAKQQFTELIRQNYNHPAILFWGIFNEITNVSGASPDALIQQLNSLAHTEDPTRFTTVASDAGDSHTTNWYSDLAAFNKYYGWYYGALLTDFANWADGIHRARPNNRIGVSEFGAGASIYQHQETTVAPTAGGNFHPEEYQSYVHEITWKQMATRRYLWSKFIWVMFDFASDGRNEGSQPGINDKGMVTNDRLTKKDSFFWYKSNWSSDPTVYITSRRATNRSNTNVAVKVYSNCDSVELKVKGQSLGIKTSTDHIFQWTVPSINNTDTVQAIGTKGGVAYTDNILWNGPAGTAPAFSPVPGSYVSAQSVTISTTRSGASIRYTVDGSTPTSTAGTLYSAPVNVSTTTTLKAIAYGPSLSDSTVTSGDYTILSSSSSSSSSSSGGSSSSSSSSGGGGGTPSGWFFTAILLVGAGRRLSARRKE